MRILSVNTVDNFGGAAKASYRLHNSLRHNGHRVKFLVKKRILAAERSIIPFKKQNDIFIKKLFYKLINLDGFLLYKNRFLRQFNFNNFDIVHLNNLHGNYFNLTDLIGLASYKPLVWTLHDMWSFTGHCAFSYNCKRWQEGCGHCPRLETYPKLHLDLTNFLLRAKERIYEQIDFTIVVPSSWLAKKTKKSILKDKNIKIIPYGVDTTIYKPRPKEKIRKRLGLPMNKIIIMYVAHGGIFNQRKGAVFFHKIFNKLKHKTKAFFLEIGSEVSKRESNYLRIPYIGKEADLSEYYSAADIFLLPSLADNFPLVVLEAMASALPVVAFRTGGIVEQIDHLQTGYLARYKSFKDLFQGLEMFFKNNNLIIKSGKLARKKIQKQFTLEQQTKEYLKLFNNLKNKC